jgi:CubicO group peptidase (beta-lactamase class C family)
MRPIFLTCAFALSLCGPLSAQTTAQTAQITPDHFAMAARYSLSHGGEAVRVEQGGRLLFEDYAPGWSASTPHKIFSGTKSFVAIAALIAQEEGLLSFDEKASDTLTEWRGDGRRSITIGQLLSHTSGLDWDLGYIYPYRDQMAAAVRIPLRYRPGSQFHYGGGNYEAFGEILRRKLERKDESVEDFIKDKVVGPLDIDLDGWVRDGSGQVLVHSGMILDAEQWAKFGQFINKLRRGEPQSLIRGPSAVLFTGHAVNPAYGLGFWVNRAPPGTQPIRDLELAIDGDQLYPGGPHDLTACVGSGHQMLYMIPSQDLVIVRFSDGERFSDGDFLSRLLTGKPHPDAHSH